MIIDNIVVKVLDSVVTDTKLYWYVKDVMNYYYLLYIVLFIIDLFTLKFCCSVS